MSGSLIVVGLGPGTAQWITPAAQAALDAATDIVGYGPYVDRVPERVGLTKHASDNRVEVERAAHALQLAADGRRVAVVSGGDPGVFAMAAAVFEALEAGPREWLNIPITVEPGITVPNNATAVSVNAQGIVEATIPGQTALQQLGQIQLTRFVNKVGLESIGDNLFIETAASGQPIDGFGGGEGFGTLQQNYLEEGNVQAVTELSSLIAAQRAYEMNSKVITAADQMMSATTQMFRG